MRALLFHTRFDILMNLKLPPLFQMLKSGIRQLELPSCEHDRAMKVDKVRIRKTADKDSWWKASGPSSASNRELEFWSCGYKFVMVEVSDANLGGGYHGAIEVYGAPM